ARALLARGHLAGDADARLARPLAAHVGGTERVPRVAVRDRAEPDPRSRARSLGREARGRRADGAVLGAAEELVVVGGGEAAARLADAEPDRVEGRAPRGGARGRRGAAAGAAGRRADAPARGADDGGDRGE